MPSTRTSTVGQPACKRRLSACLRHTAVPFALPCHYPVHPHYGPKLHLLTTRCHTPVSTHAAVNPEAAAVAFEAFALAARNPAALSADSYMVLLETCIEQFDKVKQVRGVHSMRAMRACVHMCALLVWRVGAYCVHALALAACQRVVRRRASCEHCALPCCALPCPRLQVSTEAAQQYVDLIDSMATWLVHSQQGSSSSAGGGVGDDHVLPGGMLGPVIERFSYWKCRSSTSVCPQVPQDGDASGGWQGATVCGMWGRQDSAAGRDACTGTGGRAGPACT